MSLHEEHSLRIKLEQKIDQLSSCINNTEYEHSKENNDKFETKDQLSLTERKLIYKNLTKEEKSRRTKTLNESVQLRRLERSNSKKLEKKAKKEEKKRLKLEKKKSELNLPVKLKKKKSYFNKFFKSSDKQQKSSSNESSSDIDGSSTIQLYEIGLEEKKKNVNNWNEWKIKIRSLFNNITNEEIDLSNMELNVLPESFILSKMRTCASLNLSFNQFTVWPNELSSQTLVELNLSNNSMSDFPSRIDTLANLRLLNISNNKLSFIPKSLFKLKNLEYIDISNNNIREIPNEIEHLNQLKGIQLFNNNISLLPTEISQLKDLHFIDISFNKLTIIPNSISELTNLQHIDLSFNEIESLPSSIDSLKKLNHLSVSNNRLEKLPFTLVLLPSINSILHATNNPYKDPELKEASVIGNDAIVNYLFNKRDSSLFVHPDDINNGL